MSAAFAFRPSAFAVLTHCALNGVSGWGSQKAVWAVYNYQGEMLHWSANKRAARSFAERQQVPTLLTRISGIEPT